MQFVSEQVMLLHFRYGFVGENDPVPHAPSPVVHDASPTKDSTAAYCSSSEGKSKWRMAISSASLRTSSSSVTGQGKLIVQNSSCVSRNFRRMWQRLQDKVGPVRDRNARIAAEVP